MEQIWLTAVKTIQNESPWKRGNHINRFFRMTLGARFFLVMQSKLARCRSRDEGLENALPHFSHV